MLKGTVIKREKLILHFDSTGKIGTRIFQLTTFADMFDSGVLTSLTGGHPELAVVRVRPSVGTAHRRPQWGAFSGA